ncbi:unnamed protein product [Cuscuta campestris]|uniref:Chromo domain-containing protein n=1 Tax=Cuscuta campestris TaxID=132261 RepID=A0A484NSX1_9ASTE|nr:unnamed protein product [Cuscuta campestris]
MGRRRGTRDSNGRGRQERRATRGDTLEVFLPDTHLYHCAFIEKIPTMAEESSTTGELETRVGELGNSMVQMQRDLEFRFTRLDAALTTIQANLTALQTRAGNREGRQFDRHEPPRQGTPKPKLEPPKSDGSEPLRWLYQVKEYFSYYETPPEERLRCVTLMLEGPAADWFRWRMNNGLINDWEDFLTKFKLRFDPMHYVDYLAQLSRVRQIGGVMDYQAAFERILTHVTDVPEPHLQSLFHAGIKSHLQHEISLLKPVTLSESFAMARELEAKHNAIVQSVSNRGGSVNPSGSRGFLPVGRTSQGGSVNNAAKPSILGSGPTSSTHSRESTASTPIRLLTRAEKLEKDAKGLCYNCDKKWSRDHKCGRFVLMMGEEEEEVTDKPTEDVEVTADISSLHSMAGVTTPRSLRLTGHMARGSVEVLIDGGSTHNFVHPQVVERMGLAVETVPPFQVYVGNGDSLHCDQQCKTVAVTLQGTEFVVDLYILRIHGHDVVLGVQWLRLLGRILHDYDKVTMEFKWRDQPVTLRGDTPVPRPLSLHHLRSLQGRHELEICVEILLIQDSTLEKDISEGKGPPLPPIIEQILAEYQGSLTLPDEFVQGQPLSTPVRLLASRQVLQKGKPVQQYLVEWSDGSRDDATWEPAEVLEQHFPHLHLEDKVIPQGVESDTPNDGSKGEEQTPVVNDEGRLAWDNEEAPGTTTEGDDEETTGAESYRRGRRGKFIGDDRVFFITFIYAHNDPKKRKHSWEFLQKSVTTSAWCVLGDFNTVLHLDERIGGNAVSREELQEFQDCLNHCGLDDLPFEGPKLTWTNNQGIGKRIYSKLDRVLGNMDWLIKFDMKKMLKIRRCFEGMEMKSPYSSKDGYKWLIGKRQEPNWSNMVWNKLSIPKHKIILWLLCRDRLQTKKRLSKFIPMDTACSLCSNGEEDSISIGAMNEKMMKLRPNKHRWKINTIFAACVYAVWRARNWKIYKQISIHEEDTTNWIISHDSKSVTSRSYYMRISSNHYKTAQITTEKFHRQNLISVGVRLVRTTTTYDSSFILGEMCSRAPVRKGSSKTEKKWGESREKEEGRKRELQPCFVLRSMTKRAPIGMKF